MLQHVYLAIKTMMVTYIIVGMLAVISVTIFVIAVLVAIATVAIQFDLVKLKGSDS
jgi:hypothetical protein